MEKQAFTNGLFFIGAAACFFAEEFGGEVNDRAGKQQHGNGEGPGLAERRVNGPPVLARRFSYEGEQGEGPEG